MKGKHIAAIAAFAAALWGTHAAAAADGGAPPLESVIGADVELWLGVRDLSGLRERWEDHPLRRVADNEALRDALGAADADGDGGNGGENGFTKVMEEEFGLTYDALFELFPGQAGFAVFDLASMAGGAPGERDLAILAEFSGSEERLNELMRIQFERNAEAQKEANPDMEHVMLEERFMGETLYLDEASDGENTYIEDGYALVDGIAVLAAPTERLRGLVEAIKAGADNPLDADPVYLRTRDSGARGDAGIFLNLAEWLRPKSEGWMRKLAEGLAQFGVTAESLGRALAPDAPQAAFYEAELEPGGVLAHGGLLYREKAGVLRLLNYGEGRLPEAGYVPESALASTISVFDLSGMLGRLESILTQASPNLAPLIQMQLQNVKNRTGVDLRSSVLENFGNEMVSFSVPLEGGRPGDGGAALQPQQFFALEIGDARAFSGALEAFKDLAPGLSGMMESREYAGQTVHTFRPPQPGGNPGGTSGAVSYAVTRSHFLFSVGDPALMRETLARMDGGGAGGLWQRPATRRMFERIAREGAVSRSYADLGAMVRVFATAMRQARSVAQGKPGGAEEVPAFSLEGEWRMATELNEKADGLFMRTLVTTGGDGS